MQSGFGQFCPVAIACEVFAERWTPMILRELLAGSERVVTHAIEMTGSTGHGHA